MTARTIWKKVLRPMDVQSILIPAGSEFLCAREQLDMICVWFICDPTAPEEPREIAIVGTGNPAPAPDARYLGTAALRGGQLILHVFEEMTP